MSLTGDRTNDRARLTFEIVDIPLTGRLENLTRGEITKLEVRELIGKPLYIALNGTVTSDRTLAVNPRRYGEGTEWIQTLPGNKPPQY